MKLLKKRKASLDGDGGWFLLFLWTKGPRKVAPAGFPYFPFTIVGVVSFAETEIIYYDRIRVLPSYQEAFGLLPAPAADDPVPPMQRGLVEGRQRVVQATCVRRSHFFFECAAPACCATQTVHA